jgi:hypothetical protein
VDRLRQLGYDVIGINAGRAATNDRKYFNKRAEMWHLMSEWIENGCIPDDRELKEDLCGPEYGFDNRERIQLEKKSDMKARGLASPDCADALSMTFAEPVAAVLRTSKRVRFANYEYDALAYGQ